MTRKRTRRKHLLGGHVYVVEEREGGNAIYKVPNDGEKGEVFLIGSEDGQCQCRASEFGNNCKHQDMASGTLEKEGVPIERAKEILDDYLDKLRAVWPLARMVSLLDYKKDSHVGSASVITCGVLSQYAAEKFAVWSEFGPLLVRIYCFKDQGRYRRVLRTVRKRWCAPNCRKPDEDIGSATNTTEQESENSNGTS